MKPYTGPHEAVPHPAAGGWLTTCLCGHERWFQRREAADAAADEHNRKKATHG